MSSDVSIHDTGRAILFSDFMDCVKLCTMQLLVPFRGISLDWQGKCDFDLLIPSNSNIYLLVTRIDINSGAVLNFFHIRSYLFCCCKSTNNFQGEQYLPRFLIVRDFMVTLLDFTYFIVPQKYLLFRRYKLI